MYCLEPIIGVYLGQPEDVTTHGGELFLDCYEEDIVLYLIRGFRCVLETEHFGISLGHDGVFLLPKEETVEDLEKGGEWLRSCYTDRNQDEPPWIDHAYTFFAGERLRHVAKRKDDYVLEFDDFQLKLFPCEERKIRQRREMLWRHSNRQMYGFDRYLAKKCKCGGLGLPFMDFVDDYYVVCNRCGKGIPCATMNLQAAIDDWNEMHRK